MKYTYNRHMCNLPFKDSTGLPKLPPNATKFSVWRRKLRTMLLLHPGHVMCKKLFRNKSAMFAERRRSAFSGNYVIHPLSIVNAFMEFIFFVIWIYFIMIEAVRWIIPRDVFTFFDDEFLPPIQLILILLFFNVGYIDAKTNKIIIEPRKIIRRYLTSFFIFDLTATNYPLRIVQLMTNNLYVMSWCHSIRLICFCVRTNTIVKFMWNTLRNFKLKRIIATFVVYGLRTYIYLHLLIGLVTGIPLLICDRRIPPESWIAQAKLLESRSAVQSYSECFLLVTSYFFGVAHKYDIELVNEQICVIIISLFGRLYTLFLLADVLRKLGIVGVSESAYERQMMALHQYMVSKGLPESLKHRMLRYCEFKFQGRYFKVNRIVNTLSDNLRTELFMFTARKLIEKVHFFKKLPSSTIVAIITAMTSETYSPGDIIIKAGSEVNEIYFISSGTVAIMGRNETELCHLEDGQVFGTTCLLPSTGLHLSALALETTEVFIISKDQFMEFLGPYPETMGIFFRSAKEQVREYKNLEVQATKEKVDLLTELRGGKILEKFTKRYLVK